MHELTQVEVTHSIDLENKIKGLSIGCHNLQVFETILVPIFLKGKK